MLVDFVTETINIANKDGLYTKLLSVCNDKIHDYIEFFVADADKISDAKASLFVIMFDEKDVPQTRRIALVNASKSPPLFRFWVNTSPISIEHAINQMIRFIAVDV